MTNDELQKAIDACIDVIKTETKYNEAFNKAKVGAASQLEALYKAQAARANIMQGPLVAPGEIVRLPDGVKPGRFGWEIT